MNQKEGFEQFKLKYPNMLEAALGKQVSAVFHTIQKSGILGRFGVNASAVGNFETLIKLFVNKAYNQGWTDREGQDLTTVTITKGDEINEARRSA